MNASEVVSKLNDPDVIDDHGVVIAIIHQDWNDRYTYMKQFGDLLRGMGYNRSYGVRKFSDASKSHISEVHDHPPIMDE